MKKRFCALMPAKRKKAIIITSIITALSMAFTVILPFFAYLFLISLIFLILFIKWHRKALIGERKFNRVDVVNKGMTKNAIANSSKIVTSPTLNTTNAFVEDTTSATSDVSSNIKIVSEDGTTEYLPPYYSTFENVCLYVENGRTYHTHVGCFNHWSPEMRNNFSFWYKTTIEKAEEKGLKKCRFCEYDDLPDDEKKKYKIKGRNYTIVELKNWADCKMKLQ